MPPIDRDKHFRDVLRSYPQDQKTSSADGETSPPEKDVTYSYHVLSIYKPDADPALEITYLLPHAPDRPATSVEPEHVTRPVFDPWVWGYFFKVPAGAEVRVKATVTVEGQTFTFEEPDKADATPAVSKPRQKAQVKIPSPRLILALNTTTVRDPMHDPAIAAMNFADPGSPEISAILQYVWTRLERGLGSAWLGPDGQEERFGLVPLADDSLDVGLHSAEELEEAWAQLVAEKLTTIPYAGPGLTYFDRPIMDADVFSKVNDETDPAHPLVAACQHLSTLAGIFRGFGFHGTGFDAMTISATIMQQLGGIWLPADPKTEDADPKLQNPVENAIQKGLRPGDSFLYCQNQDYPKIQGDHIAPILRIHHDRKRVQFFDTGGMGVIGDTGVPGSSGNYEYPWAYRFLGPSIKTGEKDDPNNPGKKIDIREQVAFRGVGMFNRDGPVERMVFRLLKMRPLGFARLVLRFRGRPGPLENQLAYVSPLLRMYTDKPRENFPISRLIWSLRMMPGREQLEGRWIVWTPFKALSKAMIEKPRAATTKELFTAAGASTSLRTSGDHIKPLIEAIVEKDGSITAKNWIKSQPGIATRLKTPLEESFSPAPVDPPSYFTNDWA